jgi:hypothetical protein
MEEGNLMVMSFQAWKENVCASDWLDMGEDVLYHEYQSDKKNGLI